MSDGDKFWFRSTNGKILEKVREVDYLVSKVARTGENGMDIKKTIGGEQDI